MNRFFLLVAGLAVCTINPVNASDRTTVCAHYAANYGWSDGYKVEATVSSGAELNHATGSFNYSPFDKYVVIFWSADQASVIKLDAPYLSAIETEGEDQQGRRWKVAETDLCL